ncbi:MAG: 1-deoxy-D-xylulose-5-phosphate synthase N-terminal domain-containing protein, partial [Candidatus Nanopelagicales bacterium]|nr:1-deoxy-D-xylulose-5-phosphate synthase N-terminal domain-containing protein [Candidatus Nanopelagicales bacterium]
MARIRPAASELCFDEESERVVEVASIEEVLENAGGLGITAEPYAGRFGWGTLIRLNGKPTLLTDVDHAAVQGAMAAKRCARYRRRILDISQRVSALHIAPAFSCLEITDYVYSALMRPADVFLMSKGHGCIAQYAVLEDRGVIPREEMDRYCTTAGTLGAHPDRGTPGIVASTGSLGHGLGLAVGMAYAARIKGEDCNVYVVMSDGELQEGSTWEAVQMAANLGLTNLAVFVDL